MLQDHGSHVPGVRHDGEGSAWTSGSARTTIASSGHLSRCQTRIGVVTDSRDVPVDPPPGRRATRRRSRRGRRRRTSRAAARASSHATAASATTASCLDRRHVAALDERIGRLAGPGRSTDERGLHQRREWLHRSTHDDSPSPFETPASTPPARFDWRYSPRPSATISSCASGPAEPCEREAVADLDALHGLDSHQRCGEPRIEPVLLARIRAEPRRHAARPHLDDAAERGPAPSRASSTHPGVRAGLGKRRTPPTEIARCARSAFCNPRRPPTCAAVCRADRPLERVADVGEPVLLHPPARSACPGRGQRDLLRPFPPPAFPPAGQGLIPPRPVLVIAVAHDERERRPERASVAQARKHLHFVGLDLLSRASVRTPAGACGGPRRSQPSRGRARRAAPTGSREARDREDSPAVASSSRPRGQA